MAELVKAKPESLTRWVILVLTCVMMIGNYYCYDIPAALNTQMDDYFGKPSDFETMFSLLYTVYSVPNIILPFFGGFFTDKFGARICMIVFCGFITLGQFIFALGLSMKSWPVMLLGRVVFGFGGESLGVANSAILSEWFKGKELAFAFGINLSVARLGSVINNLVSPVLADDVNIEFALWFGVVLCGSSVLSAVVIASFDKHFDKLLMDQKGAHGLLLGTEEDEDEEVVLGRGAPLGESLMGNDKDNEEEEKVPEFREVFDFKHVFWIICAICVVVYGCVLPFNNIASSLLLERDYFKEPSDSCHLLIPNQCEDYPGNYPVDCPSSKWYQPPLPDNATVGGTFYNPLTTDDIDCTDDLWKDTCTVEYCDRQNKAQLQAGTIMSIPYIISAVLSPVLGGLVDRFGYRAVIATMAPAALVLVHSLLGYTTVSPEGPLVGQGLAYAGFAAVIWPSVPLVVPQRLVGLAYGVAFSIQNAGLASFPLIIAAIYSDYGDKYIPSVETFFVIVALVGVLVGIYLNYYDYYYIDSVLNRVHLTPATGDDLADSDMTNPIHGEENKDKVIKGKVKKFPSDRNEDESDDDDVPVRTTSRELYANLH